jgi:ribonuclease R
MRRDEQRVVALLARKGRFLVGEPFFGRDDARGGAARGRRRAQLVLAPARGRGSVRAREGELALLAHGGGAGRARVLRTIGRPERPRDVIEALMLDRGLARGFTAAVEREAREAARGARAIRGGAARLDLRELATFTVDPASARDFDDAISARGVQDGLVRVWVHIADVSAYVPAGSALDREARWRGTSVYVPGTVEPMLPEALSNDLCSLRPGAERFAVSVEMDIRAGETRAGAAGSAEPRAGEIVRAAFHRSLIRSDARLEYDQVDRMFAGRERAEAPWAAALEAARAAAAALARGRALRRALELDSFEPEISFDAEGRVSARMGGWAGGLTETLGELRDEPPDEPPDAGAQGAQGARGARGVPASEARRMIEHLMIAANEAVAAHLSARRAPCLYRVHEPPDPQSVERLVEQLVSLEVPTPPLPEPMSRSQAAELLAQVAAGVRRHLDAQAAREGAAGRLALSSLVLRSLQQAYYAPRNIGHAGLASAAYCHFTSPIRRYPDLVCHRALLATLDGGEGAPDAAELAELGVWSSEREREAMAIERDAVDVARCFALERVLFDEGFERVFEGEVSGLIGAGAFVAFGGDRDAGVLPPFEGMVPVRRLRARAGGGHGAGRDGIRQRGARGPGRAGRAGAGAREGAAEWWELNEQGTILHASPSARSLRLGQALDVRVRRIEAARGRVDLEPAGSLPAPAQPSRAARQVRGLPMRHHPC